MQSLEILVIMGAGEKFLVESAIFGIADPFAYSLWKLLWC